MKTSWFLLCSKCVIDSVIPRKISLLNRVSVIHCIFVFTIRTNAEIFYFRWQIIFHTSHNGFIRQSKIHSYTAFIFAWLPALRKLHVRMKKCIKVYHSSTSQRNKRIFYNFGMYSLVMINCIFEVSWVRICNTLLFIYM